MALLGEIVAKVWSALKYLDDIGIGPMIDFCVISWAYSEFVKEKGLKDDFEKWYESKGKELTKRFIEDLIKCLQEVRKVL